MIRTKIALLDGGEWHLFWGDEDGEWLEDIEWPNHWSREYVSSDFVKSEGFQVECA